MPDTRLVALVHRVRRRARLRVTLWALAAGGAGFAAVAIVAIAAGISPVARASAGVAVGTTLAAWVVRRGWHITPLHAAHLIEGAGDPLFNLVVTAVELSERPTPVRAEIRSEIFAQAEQRLANVTGTDVVTIRQPASIATAVAIGVSVLLSLDPRTLVLPKAILPSAQASTHRIDRLVVRVTPPAYSGRTAEAFTDPVQITVISGSRVRLEVSTAAAGVSAEAAGQPPLTWVREGRAFATEWTAGRSMAIAVRPQGGDAADGRFLSLVAVPDAPPTVRVQEPGKDMAIPTGAGRIAVTVESQDDLGLASLVVRFTKASGGGESLTFTEGDVPLTVVRQSDGRWTGRAQWVLDGLGLSDGDVLVYRAIARDKNPNGNPVQSDQFLIEVGRRSEAIGAGFALPADEKKYAISQQMVIYKTEQLLATRAKHAGDWLEQNQLLAIEQRMVRAEVVFLGGGEVQDEVEEAAHSHELAEGRLENTGRAEMLKAINFMSRAEAQLNDGRAAEALVFERQALRSLELAFDRRRYFLRTLPDRARIDMTRRLTGNLTEARGWTRGGRPVSPPAGLEAQQALMRDLSASANTGTGVDAALAARIASLAPSSPPLQAAAVALATARGEQATRDAVWKAMQAVTAHALANLSSPVDVQFTLDPLAGRLADELPKRGSR